MARRKVYNYGIFKINEAREILANLGFFDEIQKAQTELAKLRDTAKLENENPYNIVVLPCGPRNEGLLPPSR